MIVRTKWVRTWRTMVVDKVNKVDKVDKVDKFTSLFIKTLRKQKSP